MMAEEYYEPPGRGTAHYERTPHRAAYERATGAPDLTAEEKPKP
jgi:hypothetical protein